MKCSVCKCETVEPFEIVLNIDGDIACSKKCKDKYIKDRDDFLNRIVHDDELFNQWLVSD